MYRIVLALLLVALVAPRHGHPNTDVQRETATQKWHRLCITAVDYLDAHVG
jgi:hypothetical protein